MLLFLRRLQRKVEAFGISRLAYQKKMLDNPIKVFSKKPPRLLRQILGIEIKKYKHDVISQKKKGWRRCPSCYTEEGFIRPGICSLELPGSRSIKCGIRRQGRGY
jgi:hypothetical protein